MLNNAYRVFNSETKLQKEDVKTFFETLDVDENNKVTLKDMEDLCIRYLTGTTLGIPYKFNSPKKHWTKWRPRIGHDIPYLFMIYNFADKNVGNKKI